MKVVDVIEEYKKNKDLHVEDIENLKEWSKKQLHLPPISEAHLIIFLHSCYWSIEQAKSTIDKYYTYRNAWPEFFADTNPDNPKVQRDMKIALFTFLPTKTPENYKIFYTRLIDLDPAKFVFADLMRIMDMNLVMETMESSTCDGLVIVCDFENTTIGHLLKTSVMEVKKFLTYLQEALPVRLKAIHFINVGRVVDLLLPLAKPFIKKELLECVHFYDAFEGILKFIPKECFPEKYGGSCLSIQDLHAQMRENLLRNGQYFIETEKLVSNELLRDKTPSYMDKDLGIGAVGSFKKLEFD
ncbi:hypothetical protein RI129_012632 [Pyrocoelia pectoralis]|uniref:CRAL-TRIO domain-containing protein n=1 Tax=Pyrocoelia pectoralis TaxID=417401 RepID=A0AAN7UYJ0_9COLE